MAATSTKVIKNLNVWHERADVGVQNRDLIYKRCRSELKALEAATSIEPSQTLYPENYAVYPYVADLLSLTKESELQAGVYLAQDVYPCGA